MSSKKCIYNGYPPRYYTVSLELVLPLRKNNSDNPPSEINNTIEARVPGHRIRLVCVGFSSQMASETREITGPAQTRSPTHTRFCWDAAIAILENSSSLAVWAFWPRPRKFCTIPKPQGLDLELYQLQHHRNKHSRD